MSDIVKLQIKITGSDSFKEVEVSADELAKAIAQVKKKTEELQNSLINANQMAQVFEQVSSAVQGLQSAMHELTEAYAVQSAAEARLEQVMRNTMGATNAEIQSIKELTAAQQELGVVGDEVQLSGAQELASYLSKKESLEALIPVMNDMIAQQYGYNATAESAIQIASMMGKVMDGQVKALSRYGYSFTEAQEEILKFGTEEERAATLAEVVESSVGGVNAALAATDYGKIVQANNKMGDLKETVGAIIAPAQKAIDKFASFSIAVAGVGKGVATIKGLGAAIKAMTANITKATIAQNGLNMAMKANIFLAVATAVAGLVAWMVQLSKETNNAIGATDRLAEADKRANEQYSEQAGRVRALTSIVENNNIALDVRKKALGELKAVVPGYLGDLTEEGRLVNSNTDAIDNYCKALQKQLRLEARKEMLMDIERQIAAAEMEKEKAIENAKEALEAAGGDDTQASQGFWGWKKTAYGEAMSNVRTFEDRIKGLESQAEAISKTVAEGVKDAADATKELIGETDNATESVSWQKMSYEDLGKAIQEQAKKVKESIAANDGLAEAEAATLNAMQQRYDAIGKQFDKLTGKVKELKDEVRQTVELVPKLASIGTPASIEVPEPTYANPKPLKGLFDFKSLGEFEQRLTELENIRKQVSQDQLPVIDAQIALVRQLKDEFEGVNQTVAASPLETFAKGWSGIKGIGNSIRDIKSALTDTDNAWDALTQTIDGFISLFQSLQAVVEIIKTITSVTKAFQVVEETATATQIAANASLSTSNTAVAATAAAASVAGIPIVGPEMALTWAATLTAALNAIPKFANGGLVYGPTLGLMGEYGGASSNPEVIAPLDKLRSLIGGNDGGGTAEVKFRIEGRELVGILDKQTNINRRSR